MIERICRAWPWACATWRMLFKPHSRPEIEPVLSAIEEKKAAGEDLRRTMKRLSERL